MGAILVNSSAADAERRRLLYKGAIFFYTPRPSVAALRDHAWELITAGFGDVDPMQAQDSMPVEQFVERVASVRPRFTQSLRARALLRDLLIEFGCDLENTYFDQPKLRIVTHSGYLSAGMGYAYKPHRDVWYAAPMCQQNWWFPLVDIGPTNSMAFHPQYWNSALPNTSSGFDRHIWNATGPKDAAEFIHSDTRNHPAPIDPILEEPQIRVVGETCSMLLFSAAQLHSTVLNTSGRTRYSVDFRTVSLEDLESGRGAANVDNLSTGTTLRDFLRGSDFTPVPENIIRRYDAGSTHERSLVYRRNPAPAEPTGESRT